MRYTSRTLAATAGILAVCASAASAQDTTERRLSTMKPANSEREREAVAYCPAGKRVLGAGVEIHGGLGRVALDRIKPAADLRSVAVHATENREGTNAVWSITAFAVCSVPPPGGVHLVESDVLAPTADSKWSLPATCPAGQQVTGTGGELFGANGRIKMSAFKPDLTDLRSVRVLSHEAGDATSIAWSVKAYAICATLPGRVHAEQRPGVVSDPLRGRSTTTIRCQEPMKVLGTAGWIQSRQLQVPAGHHFIDVLAPNSGLKSVTMTAYDGVGVNGALFDVRPMALCAVPPNVPVVEVP